VKIGEQHSLIIDSLANSGDGVGRINDLVVFVPFTSPGDHVLVEITFKKKSFLKAKVIEITKNSIHRTQPLCPVFGQCGGCDWQHIPYEDQLLWKKKNLNDSLNKIGRLDSANLIDDVIPNSTPYFYRNRIQAHVEKSRFHFYEKNSHKKVEIHECPIASPLINQYLKSSASNLKSGKIELAEIDHKIKTFNVNSKGFSDLGFRQVNSEQNKTLIDLTLNFIKNNSIKSIADLYCGQGNWSIEINRSLPDVKCMGIDIDPINIKIAKKFENENLKFYLGSVEKIAREKMSQVDLVILDPPRSGCDLQLLDLISNLNISNLLYISCHPATLARDLKILSELKWTISKIKPVDMFPQTAHLETWCLLHSAR
jgi:23S rRNA (uracil1939-C5)-methyltransferase